jgi:hypothetical protein
MNLPWRSVILVFTMVVWMIVGYLWTKEGYENGSDNVSVSTAPVVAYDVQSEWFTKYQNSAINSQETIYDVSMSTAPMVAYDTNGLDTEYHDSVDVIQQYAPKTIMVLQNGVLTELPWTDTSSNVEYYPSGHYKYGSKTYVPTYADSVFLTRRN